MHITPSLGSILVVDDIADNIQILNGFLNLEYKVLAATSGHKALAIAQQYPQPDMILLDVMMPEIDGFEVCRLLKKDPATKHIPVIFVTAKSEQVDESLGFELGAVDYITKPYNPAIVKTRVKAQLSLSAQNNDLENLVKARTHELESTRKSIINMLGKAAEYKDNDTGMHVVRMALYSKLLAEKVSEDKAWIDLIYNAAPMHDVGKIGIPDAILCKPGKLDAQEWEIMKTHAVVGAQILDGEKSSLLVLAKEVALYHHEKWNGSGYPHGLSGENIPLSARIVALADVFDALTSERPYKKAWPIEKAVQLIKEESGEHFDPDLVIHFLNYLPEFEEIAENNRN
ncbi:HD domain-containing phosphohydrolase [Moritella sp. Urea-trap-13]|uniref:HD domain-containing phosphohydrolase n=1 Tax=Moritella sp. Urea-trap-13 TaxID=2058327 RepID=UPI000C3256F7|nr:HD domain-containing phosphohydrolase [Moritella sp. Urea-trap-13]PKH09631.1 two-component system response regulator [Moritella sp. Urea-trap-13]